MGRKWEVITALPDWKVSDMLRRSFAYANWSAEPLLVSMRRKFPACFTERDGDPDEGRVPWSLLMLVSADERFELHETEDGSIRYVVYDLFDLADKWRYVAATPESMADNGTDYVLPEGLRGVEFGVRDAITLDGVEYVVTCVQPDCVAYDLVRCDAINLDA